MDLTIASAEDAEAIHADLDSALDVISRTLGYVGEQQQKIQFKQDNLTLSNINQSQALSQISDLDFAKEQIEIVKKEILQNSGISALTQSISSYEVVLELL